MLLYDIHHMEINCLYSYGFPIRLSSWRARTHSYLTLYFLYIVLCLVQRKPSMGDGGGGSRGSSKQKGVSKSHHSDNFNHY
jgi:hypothetical protein